MVNSLSPLASSVNTTLVPPIVCDDLRLLLDVGESFNRDGEGPPALVLISVGIPCRRGDLPVNERFFADEGVGCNNGVSSVISSSSLLMLSDGLVG